MIKIVAENCNVISKARSKKPKRCMGTVIACHCIALHYTAIYS